MQVGSRFLNAEGFRMESVRTSGQGIERALSGEHELIVLDVMLPGIDGFEVLRGANDAHGSPAGPNEAVRTTSS